MFIPKYLLRCCKYNLFVSYRNFYRETLKSRSLVEVRGPDSKTFIQGLITNDIFGLGNNHGSIYSLFLNAKGRVLFDVILYGNLKTKQDDLLYIDCDSGATEKLIKHLNIYKLRKQVQIKHVVNAGIFVVIPENESESLETLKKTKIQSEKLIYFGSDPRIKSWTLRCIGSDNSIESIVSDIKTAPDDLYLRSRLYQGISEGMKDFPIGAVLPLEYNGDILNGINFNKGCYIGQELTARTHHTGVVRKRIMPVQCDPAIVPGLFASNNRSVQLVDAIGANIGTINSIDVSGFGLALIRLSSLHSDTSSSQDGRKIFQHAFIEGTNHKLTIHVPLWWPPDVLLPNS